MIGPDEKGTIVLREKVPRPHCRIRPVNVPRCLIGIEVGTVTHYMCRELLPLGNDVKQVSPAYARPSLRSHKDDFRNAQAVAEAVPLSP
jgi:transposase